MYATRQPLQEWRQVQHRNGRARVAV
jgi:hypothetical protein